MKNLKLVETASEAVQNEYLTIYGVKEDGSMVIKKQKELNPTRWYQGDTLIKELDVVGELSSTYNPGYFTRCDIGDNVTSIGKSAFYYKDFLTSVTISDSVTSIGYNAFQSCSSLLSAVIPNLVTSIQMLTFAYCSSLTSVTIPDSVTSIEANVFNGCTSLTSVTYNGTIAQWNAISKGTYWKNGVPTTCQVHCTDGDIAI